MKINYANIEIRTRSEIFCFFFNFILRKFRRCSGDVGYRRDAQKTVNFVLWTVSFLYYILKKYLSVGQHSFDKA